MAGTEVTDLIRALIDRVGEHVSEVDRRVESLRETEARERVQLQAHLRDDFRKTVEALESAREEAFRTLTERVERLEAETSRLRQTSDRQDGQTTRVQAEEDGKTRRAVLWASLISSVLSALITAFMTWATRHDRGPAPPPLPPIEIEAMDVGLPVNGEGS